MVLLQLLAGRLLPKPYKPHKHPLKPQPHNHQTRKALIPGVFPCYGLAALSSWKLQHPSDSDVGRRPQTLNVGT